MTSCKVARVGGLMTAGCLVSNSGNPRLTTTAAKSKFLAGDQAGGGHNSVML